MLLCDAAQEVGGKLYVLGGGFSVVNALPGGLTNLALAVKINVPWDQTNRKVKIEAALMTDDGDRVDLGAGPIGAAGEFEVGRPPGVKPGSDIGVPLALPFPGLKLPLGGYRWEFSVNGTVSATTAFRVQPAPGLTEKQFREQEGSDDD
jgi:hypothetical protein